MLTTDLQSFYKTSFSTITNQQVIAKVPCLREPRLDGSKKKSFIKSIQVPSNEPTTTTAKNCPSVNATMKSIPLPSYDASVVVPLIVEMKTKLAKLEEEIYRKNGDRMRNQLSVLQSHLANSNLEKVLGSLGNLNEILDPTKNVIYSYERYLKGNTDRMVLLVAKQFRYFFTTYLGQARISLSLDSDPHEEMLVQFIDQNTRLMERLINNPLKLTSSNSSILTEVSREAVHELMQSLMPYFWNMGSLGSPEFPFNQRFNFGVIHFSIICLLSDSTPVYCTGKEPAISPDVPKPEKMTFLAVILRLLRDFTVELAEVKKKLLVHDKKTSDEYWETAQQLGHSIDVLNMLLKNVHFRKCEAPHLMAVMYEIYSLFELYSQTSKQDQTGSFEFDPKSGEVLKQYVCSVFDSLGMETAWKSLSMIDKELLVSGRTSNTVALYKFLASRGYIPHGFEPMQIPCTTASQMVQRSNLAERILKQLTDSRNQKADDEASKKGSKKRSIKNGKSIKSKSSKKAIIDSISSEASGSATAMACGYRLVPDICPLNISALDLEPVTIPISAPKLSKKSTTSAKKSKSSSKKEIIEPISEALSSAPDPESTPASTFSTPATTTATVPAPELPKKSSTSTVKKGSKVKSTTSKKSEKLFNLKEYLEFIEQRSIEFEKDKVQPELDSDSEKQLVDLTDAKKSNAITPNEPEKLINLEQDLSFIDDDDVEPNQPIPSNNSSKIDENFQQRIVAKLVGNQKICINGDDEEIKKFEEQEARRMDVSQVQPPQESEPQKQPEDLSEKIDEKLELIKQKQWEQIFSDTESDIVILDPEDDIENILEDTFKISVIPLPVSVSEQMETKPAEEAKLTTSISEALDDSFEIVQSRSPSPEITPIPHTASEDSLEFLSLEPEKNILPNSNCQMASELIESIISSASCEAEEAIEEPLKQMGQNPESVESKRFELSQEDRGIILAQVEQMKADMEKTQLMISQLMAKLIVSPKK